MHPSSANLSYPSANLLLFKDNSIGVGSTSVVVMSRQSFQSLPDNSTKKLVKNKLYNLVL